MNSENAIISMVLGVFTFYMLYSVFDIGLSLGSVGGVGINLILGLVFGFIITILVLRATSREG